MIMYKKYNSYIILFFAKDKNYIMFILSILFTQIFYYFKRNITCYSLVHFRIVILYTQCNIVYDILQLIFQDGT